MKNIKLPPYITSLLAKAKIAGKHHYFITVVVLFGGLALGVYMVNDTLNQAADENYRTESLGKTIGHKFNASTKATIDKIKELQKTSDPSNTQTPLPGGRINPFAE